MSNTAAEPLIQFHGVVVPHAHAEVIHPPLYIGADFFASALQFTLEVRERLPGDSRSLEVERETQEDARFRALDSSLCSYLQSALHRQFF
jgi:hypothetical protein